mmetsp:Transcript_5756/g.19100  ORF Transcript_5756/g.19100 Transcript_5756/m.19100 type:complete len:290 (-) Transcript_5756:103-972(-)
MAVLRDCGEALRAVVHAVERGDVCEQGLRRADVRGRLVAPDVLLARLHRHPVRGLAVRVDRQPDDAARHLAREALRRRQEAGVRPSVPERHAEPLRRPDGDVGAPLPRWRELGEREEVRGDSELGARGVHLVGEVAIREDRAIRRRVLDQRAAEALLRRVGCVVALDHGDAVPFGPRAHHRLGLGVHPLVDEKDALSAGSSVDHGHRLGGGGRLVEQRRVAHLHRCQVRDHRLKVHQRLEPALRHLGLVGRVLRVPARVLQHVAQDHRRRLAVVVPHPEHRAHHLVWLD